MEADAQQIGAARDVVGRVGMALRGARDPHRAAAQVARALRRGHDHRRGAVGLEGAVVEAEGLGDPAGGEVLVHRERLAAEQRLRVALRVAATRESDAARGLVGHGVALLVVHADPGVELHRPQRAVGQVEGEQLLGGGGRREAELRAARAGPRPEGREAVPAHHHEHVAGDAGGDREGRALERGDRAGAAHVHRHRVAELGDAEVRRQELGGGEARRRQDAVELPGREAGVVAGRAGGLEHQLLGEGVGAAQVVRLADPDDRGLAREAHAPARPTARYASRSY